MSIGVGIVPALIIGGSATLTPIRGHQLGGHRFAWPMMSRPLPIWLGCWQAKGFVLCGLTRIGCAVNCDLAIARHGLHR